MKELLKDRNKVCSNSDLGEKISSWEMTACWMFLVGFLKAAIVDEKENGIEGIGDSLISVLGMGRSQSFAK